MRTSKIFVAMVAGFALLFALAGCQAKDEAEAPVSDVEQLEIGSETADTPFYVLVAGNDSRIGTTEITKDSYADGTGRSDTIMLVRVDPGTYQIGIITVPRDTATVMDGATVKINEVYRQKGIDGLSSQIKQLTGVAPLYYFDMGFVDFENFVDDLGGLTANVPIDMELKDIISGNAISLTQGSQDLNGAEALVLARSRKQYADDLDACRQIQDRQLLQVAIAKVAADPANAAQYASALMGCADTNMDAEVLANLVADFSAHADRITFVSGTGPFKGDIDADTQLWLAYRDEETWTRVVAAVEAGEDPTTIVPLPNVSAL